MRPTKRDDKWPETENLGTPGSSVILKIRSTRTIENDKITKTAGFNGCTIAVLRAHQLHECIHVLRTRSLFCADKHGAVKPGLRVFWAPGPKLLLSLDVS